MLRLLKELISPDSAPDDRENAPEGMLITGRAGLVAGTQVATESGWRPVETLCTGDRLLSFDNGMQPLADLQRDRLGAVAAGRPVAALQAVEVPVAALGNDAPFWLMPDQGVLLESDKALEILGDPFAVVPARALVGVNGIRLAAPGGGVSVTTLAFARDEAIYIAGGPLLFCPRPRRVVGEGAGNDMSFFSVQTLQSARYLVRALIEARGFRALSVAPDEIAGYLPPPLPRNRTLAG